MIVALPVPLDDYINDLGPTDEHRLDYDGAERGRSFATGWRSAPSRPSSWPALTRGEAYLRAGRYIVEHSDVMVAVWDGRKAQGRGGTGEIVDSAKKLGKPIAMLGRELQAGQSLEYRCGRQARPVPAHELPGGCRGRWTGE